MLIRELIAKSYGIWEAHNDISHINHRNAFRYSLRKYNSLYATLFSEPPSSFIAKESQLQNDEVEIIHDDKQFNAILYGDGQFKDVDACMPNDADTKNKDDADTKNKDSCNDININDGNNIL